METDVLLAASRTLPGGSAGGESNKTSPQPQSGTQQSPLHQAAGCAFNTPTPNLVPGQPRESDLFCFPLGTPSITSALREVRNATEHPRCYQGSCRGHHLPCQFTQVMEWKVASEVSH